VLAPLAIFILCLSFASNMGVELAAILVNYLAMECGILLLATALLYALTSLAGGLSLRRFAAGVLPAQLVAVSTRSSLASLPALLEGARNRLKLQPAVADLVLPLSVAVFKLNRPMTSMFGLLVLAHLFSIDLSTGQILAFFLTTLVISFSSVGIPLGGSAMLSLPAYLAAGIPIEGYLLLKTVDSIPDILKTLLNVTADLSVAAILDRRF
jgi:proton glutamate symport protein